MQQRTIKGIHKAVYEPIGDLVTYRAMPTHAVAMNQVDPFIFLNHHGWQEYLPHNQGLPFGPHPHRGFETVTFILEGELVHKDSTGYQSAIGAGGVQWMTAGSGLIHAEVSSEAFKAKGGPLEILQLWVNLPSGLKMTSPAYRGLQQQDIPVVEWDGGRIRSQLIAGTWEGAKGSFEPLTDIHLSCQFWSKDASKTFSVPREQTIFLYVVKGVVEVNAHRAQQHHLVEFRYDGEEISIQSDGEAIILFGYATPYREPIAAYGPFVMNTKEEVMQAYEDYHQGKLGREEDLL